MSKDKQNKDLKKTPSIDKAKVLSSYKMESQSKAIETPIPKLKR